jgi:hypothetical protein
MALTVVPQRWCCPKGGARCAEWHARSERHPFGCELGAAVGDLLSCEPRKELALWLGFTVRLLGHVQEEVGQLCTRGVGQQ